MATAVKQRFDTMGEVLQRLGGIDPDRVRLWPVPGTATEHDLLDLLARTDQLYELVDGTLVEKVMGTAEAFLALELGWRLRTYLQQHDLGCALGADAAARLMPGLVRVPDLSFISWARMPQPGTVPLEPLADRAPDLAVEILSPSNTPGEMNRKLTEYFNAGVRLVWYVDPAKRGVTVYTAVDQATVLGEDDTLTGGDLLPGFTVPLRELFARVAPAKKPRQKR